MHPRMIAGPMIGGPAVFIIGMWLAFASLPARAQVGLEAHPETTGPRSGISPQNEIIESLSLEGLPRNQGGPTSELRRDQKPPSSELLVRPTDRSTQETSSFELFIQGKLPTDVSTGIKQFGYDLFQEGPDTFAPIEDVPVESDYPMGPGDEIIVTLWGKVNTSYSAIIDTEGKVTLPQMGVLHLSGLSFGEARDFLRRELNRYYKPTEVKLNVSMGRLRAINVFVVGKARFPGRYTLSSLSTLINALFASGGPSKGGSMRDIQVKRNGLTVVHFDLYDLLLKGDKSKDIRLRSEDVIFIPTVGTLVGIAGHVKSPAIYELKDDMRLLDLIEMAGGLAAMAFEGRVQIQRVTNHEYSTLFETDLIDIESDDQKNINLMDADLIRIYPVVEKSSIVTLRGAVARPGDYGIIPGTARVQDVVQKAGGLLYYSSENAEIARVTVREEGPKEERIEINIKRAMMGNERDNVVLQSNDYIFIKSIPEWRLHRSVLIEGEVRYPGNYAIRKGETLSSVIQRAGGVTDDAYLKGAVFTRESVRKLQQDQLNQSIDRLEQQILSQTAVSVETALSPEAATQQEVASEQRRLLLAKLRTAQAKGRITIQLEEVLGLEGSKSDLILEDQDRLSIPHVLQQVQVIGAVFNATSFVYDPKKSVSRYLKLAGGMTASAESNEMYILKVDGSAISKKQTGGIFKRSLMSHRLDPGDTIVIPEKIDRIAWLREIKDITQIFYQIALTTGVLIAVF